MTSDSTVKAWRWFNIKSGYHRTDSYRSDFREVFLYITTRFGDRNGEKILKWLSKMLVSVIGSPDMGQHNDDYNVNFIFVPPISIFLSWAINEDGPMFDHVILPSDPRYYRYLKMLGIR